MVDDDIKNEDIRKFVEAFKSRNGNKNFTNKELIIYFNKKNAERMVELEKQLEVVRQTILNLPCHAQSERIVKIETTNKVVVAIVGVGLTIIGLAVTIFGLI